MSSKSRLTERLRFVLQNHPRIVGLVICVVLYAVLDLALGSLLHHTIWGTVPEGTVEHRIRSGPLHHVFKPLSHTVDEPWGGKRLVTSYINSLGMRDKSMRQVSLTSAKPRLLFLGDSFTEGVGCRYEDTFVGRVDASLVQEGIEVLNGGVGSYSPTLYERSARHLIDDLKLSVNGVVVFLDLSDIHDECLYFERDDKTVGRWELGHKWAHAPAWLTKLEWPLRAVEWLHEHSLALNIFLRLRSGFPKSNKDGQPTYAAGHRRGSWDINDGHWNQFAEVGLARATAKMNKLRAFLSEHHIPLTLAIYPWPDQILARHTSSSRHSKHWAAWAADHKVLFLNLFPAFIDSKAKSEVIINQFYIPGDFHWNEEGHEFVARRFRMFFHERLNELVTSKVSN